MPGKKEKEENAKSTPVKATPEEYSGDFFQELHSNTKDFVQNSFPFGGPLIDRVNLEIDKKAFPKKYFGTMEERGISNSNNGIKVEESTNQEAPTKIDGSNNVADNKASITNTGNSNFKQTADMGSAFDSSSDTYDESEFSWLDGIQNENEKSTAQSLLNNTNQNENAVDVSYKNKVEQDVIKSTGKAVKERNFMSSKTRGGLFGNYGKQVKINKIVDPNTGKVNREKYVDGKLTKSTAEKDRFKREKKSGRETGRANKKANRNK